jgi:hypothetical protein
VTKLYKTMLHLSADQRRKYRLFLKHGKLELGDDESK